MAWGWKWAKNGLPTRDGSRAWIIRSTNTLVPLMSAMPWMHIVPGVADMEGPRTVRHSPDTPWQASRKIS